MSECTDGRRSYKHGIILIAATILVTGILLVPSIIVFCDRYQSYFSYVFLLIESGLCIFFLLVAYIICDLIEDKETPIPQNIIGPDELLRPLRHSLHESIYLGLFCVLSTSLAASFVIWPGNDSLWLGFPILSWMMLPCGIILAVGMLVIMIRTIRAMNRIMEGMYKVYLAECTSTDYDYDPDSHSIYYVYFIKAEDERPKCFRTGNYGIYLSAKPGDKYYLLVVGRKIVNFLRADEYILSDEFKDRLIEEQAEDML